MGTNVAVSAPLFCCVRHIPVQCESKAAPTQSKGLVKDGWKAYRGQERVEQSYFKEIGHARD
jgi:hypothetical protein